jgi:hypothetical protein
MEYVRSLLAAWHPGMQYLHQYLIDTLRASSTLSFNGVRRGLVMSAEMNEQQKYPQLALDSLRDLIQEYDEINDNAIINGLQRSIAVTQDDAGVGIKLAREVKDAIQRIRAKDAIGARIVVLATLLQIHHVDLYNRHHVFADHPLDENTERILQTAIRRLEGADPDTLQLSESDLAVLATYLQVSPDAVPYTLKLYIDAAANSLFVERIPE